MNLVYDLVLHKFSVDQVDGSNPVGYSLFHARDMLINSFSHNGRMLQYNVSLQGFAITRQLNE